MCRSARHLDDLDAFVIFFLQIDHLRFAAAALATALTLLVAAKQVGGAISSHDGGVEGAAGNGDREESIEEGKVVQILRCVGSTEHLGREGTRLAIPRIADRVDLLR